jgi:hypothetical protein
MDIQGRFPQAREMCTKARQEGACYIQENMKALGLE